MVEVVLRSLIIKEMMENMVKIVEEKNNMNWKKLVDANAYIQGSVSNKTKDINSLSSLINRDLSQSDCIKLGTGIEKVLVDCVLAQQNHVLVNIKQKNKKGVKERDHLFKDEVNKTIYYAELKSNLNLDTEKCKSTSAKCIQIVDELKKEFIDYHIELSLVGLRYFHTKDIPKIISNKYVSIQDNVVGINEYMGKLKVYPGFQSEEKYKDFLNYVADSMFK
jgi:hypothetical protein